MNTNLRTGRLLTAALLALAAPMLAQAPSAPSRQTLIDELVLANHILANEGVLDGYGHVSVRSPADPSRYFLARSGAPGLVTAADITEYDLDSAPAPGARRRIHRALHPRRDLPRPPGCHGGRALPLPGRDSVRGASVPMRPDVPHGLFHRGWRAGLGHRKAAWDTDMLDAHNELGRALLSNAREHPAALMRGHGAVIAAASLHLAVGLLSQHEREAPVAGDAARRGQRHGTSIRRSEKCPAGLRALVGLLEIQITALTGKADVGVGLNLRGDACS